jgi:hypothetical protein
MITLKQWFELVDYRITDSCEYTWKCYGNHAQTIDSWNGDHNGASCSVVFDRKTQEVYEVGVFDYQNQRAYRIINPDYKSQYLSEASERGVAQSQAWDDVDYVDLETVEDWIEKASAILTGQQYDTRVQIPLDLGDEELFSLMKLAHEQDITLNQLVENIIREQIDRN